MDVANKLYVVYNFAGTAIDQAIAYVLMFVALVLTYIIHWTTKDSSLITSKLMDGCRDFWRQREALIHVINTEEEKVLIGEMHFV